MARALLISAAVLVAVMLLVFLSESFCGRQTGEDTAFHVLYGTRGIRYDFPPAREPRVYTNGTYYYHN